MKLCKHCKYYECAILKENKACLRKGKRVNNVDMVSGNEIREIHGVEAYKERYSILPWRCGKKARYFEPKGV